MVFLIIPGKSTSPKRTAYAREAGCCLNPPLELARGNGSLPECLDFELSGTTRSPSESCPFSPFLFWLGGFPYNRLEKNGYQLILTSLLEDLDNLRGKQAVQAFFLPIRSGSEKGTFPASSSSFATKPTGSVQFHGFMAPDCFVLTGQLSSLCQGLGTNAHSLSSWA